jgi:transcriptional regulator of met regulon
VFFSEPQPEEPTDEGKPSNRQTVKTTLYIPLGLMKQVDMRRYELLEQSGRKATKSQIMIAALAHAVQTLERLQDLLAESEGAQT